MDTDLARIVKHAFERSNYSVYIASGFQEPERLAECQLTNDVECICPIKSAYYISTMELPTVLQPRSNIADIVLSDKFVQLCKESLDSLVHKRFKFSQRAHRVGGRNGPLD